MDDSKLLEQMRADWNQRAGLDANYFVAFAQRDQDDEEFFGTAADVIRDLESQLNRLRGRDAALEIGCGPGRLMRPLSRHFREIHGVDVSEEMVRLARERLRNTPNAQAHHGSGADLAQFPPETFDYVYSYAVFQHIPSRDVVFSYLREARRVLKTGGILRCQVNGLPPHSRQYDTWSGVRISPAEIAQFARENDFQLLCLEKIWTQYMWFTCRKRPAGWTDSLTAGRPRAAATIRKISNALTGELVAPLSGPMASLSLWMEGVPDELDLNHVTITANGLACRSIYIGEPQPDGVSQVDAALPEGLRTGFVPVEIQWLGQAICAPGWLRIMPAGPLVPRLAAITDGINLLAGNRVESGSVKAVVLEASGGEGFRATVDGIEAPDTDVFCVDAVMQRYEFNFHLPKEIGRGRHSVTITVGKRDFAPVDIEVA